MQTNTHGSALYVRGWQRACLVSRQGVVPVHVYRGHTGTPFTPTLSPPPDLHKDGDWAEKGPCKSKTSQATLHSHSPTNSQLSIELNQSQQAQLSLLLTITGAENWKTFKILEENHF